MNEEIHGTVSAQQERFSLLSFLMLICSTDNAPDRLIGNAIITRHTAEWLLILGNLSYYVRPFREWNFSLWLIWTWMTLRQGNDGWIRKSLLKWIT